MANIDEYKGERITILNEGKRCIHSRHCVLNSPGVSKPNVDGPWIDPGAAATEATIAVITKCPSGALRYRPEGETPAEGAPGVNTVRVAENGPLVVYAELNVGGDTSSHRATLCRCGKSFNKPYCDKMHEKAGFKATGEPESGEAETPSIKNSSLNV